MVRNVPGDTKTHIVLHTAMANVRSTTTLLYTHIVFPSTRDRPQPPFLQTVLI